MRLNPTSADVTLTDEGATEVIWEQESPQPDSKKRKLRGLVHSLSSKVEELARVNHKLLQMINPHERDGYHEDGQTSEGPLPESTAPDSLTEPELDYRLSSLLELLRQSYGFEDGGIFLLKNGNAGLEKLILSPGVPGCEDLQELQEEVDAQWENGDIARAVGEKRKMVFPAKKEGNFLIIPFEVLDKKDGFWVAHFKRCALPEKKSAEELLFWMELISSCIENYYLKQSSLLPQKDEAQQIETEKLFTTVQLSKAMVHEINNYLQIILGKTQLLKMGEKKSPKRRSNTGNLETIEGNANRVCSILKDFSDYLHRQFDKTTDAGEVNLQHILKSNLALIEYILRSKGIKLEVSFDGDLPAVHGNPGELEQAFLNLIWGIKEHFVSGGTIRLQMFREENSLRVNMNCAGKEAHRDQSSDVCDMEAGDRFKRVSRIVEKYHGQLEPEKVEEREIRLSLRLPLASGVKTIKANSHESGPKPVTRNQYYMPDEPSLTETQKC